MSQPKKRSRHIPKHVEAAVRAREKGRCRICGAKSEYMEFDHITPYSKGAPATVDNIQHLCRKCNLAKGNKTPECSSCGGWLPHDASYCQTCGSRQRLAKSSGSSGAITIVRKIVGASLLLYAIFYLLLYR